MSQWSKTNTVKEISAAKYDRVIKQYPVTRELKGYLDPYYICKLNLHPICNFYWGWQYGEYGYILTHGVRDVRYFRIRLQKDGSLEIPYAATRNTLNWALIHHERVLQTIRTNTIINYRETVAYQKSMRDYSRCFNGGILLANSGQKRYLSRFTARPVQTIMKFLTDNKLIHQKGISELSFMERRHMLLCLNHHLGTMRKTQTQHRCFGRMQGRLNATSTMAQCQWLDKYQAAMKNIRCRFGLTELKAIIAHRLPPGLIPILIRHHAVKAYSARKNNGTKN